MKKKITYIVSYVHVFFQKVAIIILHGISLFFRPHFKFKSIWIIMERGFEAQDNAWHFFKYIKNSHPEIDARFAIVRSSPDYATNLSPYKNDILEYGSLKYFIELFNAKYLVSTHLQTYVYFNSIYQWFSHSIFDIKAKKVFLQHGITHNFHPTFEYPKLDINLFIAGAYNEYQLLTTLYKYPKDVAKYTGFARFDNLFNNTRKKQVLIMPTWRAKYSGFNKKKFENTDFYVAYKEILTDKILIETLGQLDYELLFYNHFEFQKYNQSFESLCGDRVKLIKFGEKKVQDLLKEASLLVTDYSSVYYDFFYMKKPIIFFKLNKEEFESSQYGTDYDNPSDFGYVSYTAKATIELISMLLKNDCFFADKFSDQHSKVFTLYDQNNCERTYNAIVTV